MATLKNTTINDTGFLTFPVGTTAQRPASPANGMVRFNTTLNSLEGYYAGTWGNVWIPFTPITATGGTITTTVIGGRTYNVHTFTASANTSFSISSTGTPGNTFEVIMWGAGGGGGGNSGNGASGGAGAYAKSTLTAQINTYTVSAGGGGGAATDGCVTCCGGAGGSGWAAGGRGSDPGPSPCSSPGGGGGAGSVFALSSTIVVAAAGGGGGGGAESGGGAGGGGGGGQAGYNGYGGVAGGATGNQSTSTGASGPTPSGDKSAGGGGGGGYRGGDYGQPPNQDGVGGAGGGGGSSLADTVINGSGVTPGNSADTLRGSYGNAGGAIAAGTQGVVIIRYPITPATP